jgi:dihydroorotate dehydrogenase electron transfer subunit
MNLKLTTAMVIESQVVSPDMHPAHGAASSHLLWLECPEIASESRPGQFVMVGCGPEFLLRRPLSIHRIHYDNIALFFLAWEDRGTAWLARRKAKDKVSLLGPLGNGFALRPEAGHILLAAGGMGIAPLACLAETASKQGKRVSLLMGTRYTDQLLPASLLPGVETLTVTTEDGLAGIRGCLTDVLPDYAPDADQVFACGPVGMYCAMARMSQTIPKLKSAQISLEMRMGCGRGICYACTVRTRQGLKQVCHDGPVFELGDIIWDEFALSGV